MAEAKNALELNTAMMRNTFKIEGEGSTGTCFLVGRPLKENPQKAFFVFVTAAHVFEEMRGEEATIYLRRKKVEGSFEKIPYKVWIRQNGKALWVRNKSGEDVAAFYLALPTGVDFELLPTSFFADDRSLTDYEIHPGDEMQCMGFPFGMESNAAGFPILRSGKVASFPLVPTKENRSFWLDLAIFKGNSGGPVYFVEANRYYAGAFHIGKIQFIAGIVTREFSATETIASLYEVKQQVHPLGLADVVHASHILDTINQLPEPKID